MVAAETAAADMELALERLECMSAGRLIGQVLVDIAVEGMNCH